MEDLIARLMSASVLWTLPWWMRYVASIVVVVDLSGSGKKIKWNYRDKVGKAIDSKPSHSHLPFSFHLE